MSTIAFDAASNSGAKNNVNNWTWAHTCSGLNRIIVVSVSWFTTAGYSSCSVTYNGVALTNGTLHYYGGPGVAIFYLVNPPTGSHNVVVTFAGVSVWGAAGAVSLTSVAQVNPVRSTGSGSSGNVTSMYTGNMSVVAGDYVVDSFFGGESISGTSPATGQTQRYLIQSSRTHSLGQSTKAITSTGTTTMGWLRPSNPEDMSVDAIVFKQASPEINIKQDTTDISSGGSYDYSLVALGEGKSVTFAIENLGDANLFLTGDPLVAISGTDADEFEVTSQPSSPVAESGSTTFTVKFTPDTAESKTATITIYNNDSNEGTYTFTITGEGDGTIYIGPDAINRTTSVTPGKTVINKTNPSNWNGFITKLSLWRVNFGAGFDTFMDVGIFYIVGENQLTCRSAQRLFVPGTTDVHLEYDVYLEVRAGDYLGMYNPGYGQSVDEDYEGEGYWVEEAYNRCVPGSTNTFAFDEDNQFSLHGEGYAVGEQPAVVPLYLGGIANSKPFARMRGF